MVLGGRNSSWPKFKVICRNLPEEPEGTSGKIRSRHIQVKYYKVYRFGSLVLREMSDKEYVGVTFIGAALNLQMRSIIGFGL